MSNDLFATEKQILEQAEQHLQAEDLTQEAFSTLLKGYEKLLKRTRRLIKMSDRSEAEIRRLSDEQSLLNATLSDQNEKIVDTASGCSYQVTRAARWFNVGFVPISPFFWATCWRTTRRSSSKPPKSTCRPCWRWTSPTRMPGSRWPRCGYSRRVRSRRRSCARKPSSWTRRIRRSTACTGPRC